ncbi:MAG: dTDP-4-dehydrorhamnose 3,5-epimerase, partial [Candidatus Scalindua sp.]|nr:dTDP-4-dehydrorhamnose 3,5-epimerase [Candidatus Scalindua sp.]
HSKTKKQGAIRGMHFQYKPFAEMKLIRCLKGKVFDVAVDLRKHSSTYLSWYAEILSPENATMFIVPEGCAHGFQVLEPDSELLYLHTAFYNPEYEGGILYDDPAVGIEWPMACSEISDRDKQYALINNSFHGIKV